jgi:hypothetical protein
MKKPTRLIRAIYKLSGPWLRKKLRRRYGMLVPRDTVRYTEEARALRNQA